MYWSMVHYRRIHYYINTNKIPDELSHKNIISSHVNITYYLNTWTKLLLLRLHIKSRLSWPFAAKVKLVGIYLQNSKLFKLHPPNLKLSILILTPEVYSAVKLEVSFGGFFWRSPRHFLSNVKWVSFVIVYVRNKWWWWNRTSHGCLGILNFSSVVKKVSLFHCTHSWNI